LNDQVAALPRLSPSLRVNWPGSGRRRGRPQRTNGLAWKASSWFSDGQGQVGRPGRRTPAPNVAVSWSRRYGADTAVDGKTRLLRTATSTGCSYGPRLALSFTRSITNMAESRRTIILTSAPTSHAPHICRNCRRFDEVQEKPTAKRPASLKPRARNGRCIEVCYAAHPARPREISLDSANAASRSLRVGIPSFCIL